MDEEETHVSKDGKHKNTRTFEPKKLQCTPGKGTDAAERMDRWTDVQGRGEVLGHKP